MTAVFHTRSKRSIEGTDGAVRAIPWRRVGIAALAGGLGIWATSALGFWQLRRAADKEVSQAAVEAAAAAAPVALDGALLRDPAALVHRHLGLRGRWVPDRAIYLDNRPHAGQAGFFVLMPLDLDLPAGEVIVNRGWTPRNRDDRTRIDAYRTPEGIVEIIGVALADEPRLLDLASSAEGSSGPIRQNFDLAAYARSTGRTPLPLVLRQDADAGSSPGRASDDGLLRDWPDRGRALQAQIDRHHGYAFQWFALAATLGVLLLVQFLRVIPHGRRSSS